MFFALYKIFRLIDDRRLVNDASNGSMAVEKAKKSMIGIEEKKTRQCREIRVDDYRVLVVVVFVNVVVVFVIVVVYVVVYVVAIVAVTNTSFRQVGRVEKRG